MDIKKLSRYLLIGLLLIATLFLLWNHSVDNFDLDIEINDRPEADAYIINGTQASYNPQGKLTSIVRSEKLEHFPEPTPGILIKPDIQLFTYDNASHQKMLNWHLRSEQGVFDIKAETLHLITNVIATHPGQNGNKLKLETSELFFDNKNRFIHTNAKVRLTQQASELTSTGMNIHLDAKTIQLNADVRGTYVPSPE